MNLVIFYAVFFFIMTSPCYYDVTHFSDRSQWKLHSISYVKFKIKDILLVRIFDFLNIYWENYDYKGLIMKITSIVQLPSYREPGGRDRHKEQVATV